jgi:transcriptional regulator with XRE-family HTH domain
MVINVSNFAENLKKIRFFKKSNQSELAEKINVSQATISQYENAERIPSEDIIIRLACALEVTIDDLIFNDVDAISKAHLITKIKGLSSHSIPELTAYVDYLIFKESGYKDGS